MLWLAPRSHGGPFPAAGNNWSCAPLLTRPRENAGELWLYSLPRKCLLLLPYAAKHGGHCSFDMQRCCRWSSNTNAYSAVAAAASEIFNSSGEAAAAVFEKACDPKDQHTPPHCAVAACVCCPAARGPKSSNPVALVLPK